MTDEQMIVQKLANGFKNDDAIVILDVGPSKQAFEYFKGDYGDIFDLMSNGIVEVVLKTSNGVKLLSKMGLDLSMDDLDMVKISNKISELVSYEIANAMADKSNNQTGADDDD